MRRGEGFTLVELMVVIVIIAVLAAVAIPKFAASISKAKASESMTTLKLIETAEHAYHSEIDSFVVIPFVDADGDRENENLTSILSIQIKSKYFKYFVRERAGLPIKEAFEAVALVDVPFRPLSGGEEVLLNESNERTIVDPKNKMQNILRNWK